MRCSREIRFASSLTFRSGEVKQMKLVQINSTCRRGSTGKICAAISGLLTREGIENHILYTHDASQEVQNINCGTPLTKVDPGLSKFTGLYGFTSYWETRKMLSALERIQPDLVQIHNIHGHDCNLETLCNFLADRGIQTVWTFHDCWAFTGYCTYFDLAGCNRWRSGCFDCPQRKKYSWLFDRSSALWERKRKAVSRLNLTIVTPSAWLAGLVSESFLKDVPTHVIHNGIDRSVFHPCAGTFRERYGLEGRKLVLGVALVWDKRKGLADLIQLSSRLPEDYRIVVIGTNDAIDRTLPPGIISIHRTHNQAELAEIYSAADVLVNPTYEDNFPTVNLEALACGTPVITYRTGGSPESLNEACGRIIPQGDSDALLREVLHVCEHRPFSPEDCTKRAENFDQNNCFTEYIRLYHHLHSGQESTAEVSV